MFLKKGQTDDLETAAVITKFVEVDNKITQSTCNLKYSVAIYISYTKEKNNA